MVSMGAVAVVGAAEPPPSALPPEDNLAPRDVRALADELVTYHARFAPLFQRAEQRHWALKYLQGQLLDLERKSVEPMALALEGGNVQAMQQFIGVGAWDDGAVLRRHQELFAETLGDPETGVLVLDGCDFPKQGGHSVGVAPQWCGPLGKVANCQASVVACYASRHGYTLVDRRLFLPERWFTPAYAERWRDCGIPAGTPSRTAPELAAELVEELHRRGALPFRWVTFDEHFGNCPALLDRVAALGLRYLAEVPHPTRVWLERPPVAVPPAKPKGRPPRRSRVAPDAAPAVRVDVLAAQLPAEAWVRCQIKEGAKGPLVADFAWVRAVAVRDGLPGPDVWVVLRRSRDGSELKTYRSNAPPEASPTDFVWLSGMRWPVESAILEAKSEVGLDHHEVRSWVGWHHHTAMSLLAHHFLVRLRRRLGGKGARAHRLASPPSPHRRPPPAPARRGRDPRPAPADPAPELRRLPRPSPPHPAPARQLLTN